MLNVKVVVKDEGQSSRICGFLPSVCAAELQVMRRAATARHIRSGTLWQQYRRATIRWDLT